MSRADPQINIRVPIELKKDIEHAAINNSRSINAEAVLRLQESFKANKLDKSTLSTEELLEEITKRFGGLEIILKKLD